MVKEDRKNRCRGPCRQSTMKSQKEAGSGGTCLFIYRHTPNTKTTDVYGTKNAGDNDTNKLFTTDKTKKTKIMATDTGLDNCEVICPRCRHVLQRTQRTAQQIPIVEGIFSRTVCKHCQAHIENQSQVTKEQFINSKLKSEGKLLRRRKEEELLKDTEVFISNIRSERQKTIPSKIDPCIKPFIPLKLDDDSLSDTASHAKRVSIKGTIEVIKKPPYSSGLDIDDTSESRLFLPPRHDMLLDEESGISIKIKTRRKRLFETETKTLRKPRKLTTNLKQFSNIKSHQYPEKHLSINSLLTRLSEVPQNILEKNFQFNFPKKNAKKKLGEKKIGDKIFNITDSLARLQKQAEEAKKKNEQEKKKQVRIGMMDKSEGLSERQRKEGGSDRISRTSESDRRRKEGGSDRISRTSESDLSKTDESLHKSKKKRQTGNESYESKEDLGKVRKGQKKREMGLQDYEQEKKGKDQEFKKENVRGKVDKEKSIPASRMQEKKSDKEKASFGKGLPAPGKDQKKYDMGKVLPARGKGLPAPGKEKESSDKEKALLATNKGLHEQEENGNKKGLLDGNKKGLLDGNKKGLLDGEKQEKNPDEGMWYLPPGKEDNDKEKVLPSIGKRFPVPDKDKNQEKALPVREKGLQQEEKENIDKSQKKKVLSSSEKEKIEEKAGEEKIWYLAPKNQKEKEIPTTLKKEKLENLKVKSDVIAAEDAITAGGKTKTKDVRGDDAVLSGKVEKTKKIVVTGDDAVLSGKVDKAKQKASKSKGGEENKQIKQKGAQQEEKDLFDKNNIRVLPTDNVLSNMIIQMKKRDNVRKVPTTINIPPPPVIKPRPKLNIVSGNIEEPDKTDRDFIESVQGSESVDEVIYKNKIIKKQKIPLAYGAAGIKERTADIVYNNIFKEDDLLQRTVDIPHTTKVAKSHEKSILSKEQSGDGILRYALSDRTFIDKGWTMLPIEKVVCKTNVYRMRPAHPEFDWFEHNKVKGVMHYDSGEKLAEFKDNRLGQWFYRNGRLALNYYDAEDANAQQRIVIYSNGENDERGRSRPITILGMFDYVGNGVIFDHTGKIRLKYNQTEGVVLDREIGPISHWKWHSLNDPPVLQQVMIDTQMLLKDPRISKLGLGLDNPRPETNKDMMAIEFENTLKEKSQKMTEKFKPFQIKMKALKINENFSIRILDQASIYLLFRDGTTNLKLNLGMILDSREIIDTDTADLGEISTGMERLPAITDSLAVLQRNINQAKRLEKNRTEHECRLHPPGPAASADRIKALLSKPLKPPLTAVNCVTDVSGENQRCYSRKPSICALYYNNRLK